MADALTQELALSRGDRLRGAGLAAALTLFASGLTLALKEPWAHRTVRALAFVLLSLPPLLLALPAWRAAARRRLAAGSWRWTAAALLVGAVVPDRLLRGTAADLVATALYALVIMAFTAVRGKRTGLAGDLAVALLLWLPLEMRWVTGDFVLLRLFGLDLLLLLFVVQRPLWSPGRLVPASRREMFWGVAPWAAFLVFAIPVAMATGFASPGMSQRSPGDWALFMVSTFWIIALPEEALFRGVIQSMLARRLPAAAALMGASILFGLSHLNNGPVPDLRYLLLSTVAGVAYGVAYLRTGNIAAPTLTHFLVDVTWRGFFAAAG